MTPERSRPITAQERSWLDEWAQALTGRQLAGVRYRSAPCSRWPDGSSLSEIHEVDMDVILVLNDGNTAVISWAMDGLVEGLGLQIWTDSDAMTLRNDQTEVSATPEWRPLVGETVDAVGGAWHVPNEGCPDTLWAIRLSLSGGSSVAVGLGEVEDDVVQYQPDALVVLFGEAAARRYRAPASVESAFGTTIAPR